MASWMLIADRRGAWTPSRRPAVSEQVRTSVSVALLTSVAVLGVMLSACDGERAGVPPASSVASRDLPPDAEPATQARPACVPGGESHARICALAPPRRRVDEGTAYKLTTVAGESFWAVLPDELGPPSGVVAVPGVPIRVNADLTSAPAREAADRYCHDFSECEVTVVDRVAVPSGVMTRWDDASGTIRDLDVTTVDLGQWTLVMMEPDPTRAERVSRALLWSVDQDRYPRVVSTERGVPVDVDWAGVSVWVPDLEARDEYLLIEIVPGCGLSTKQPDLGGRDARPDLELHEPDTVDGGRWCADGRYSVDVSFVERPQLELLHENLTIIPSLTTRSPPWPD
jgi:hypothetical protein